MNITIEHRNPTASHCDVAIFIDGALVGVLRLRQEEVGGFNQILSRGCRQFDQFVARGNPTPGAW